uniref:CMP/dCMP-type deaminase domain-containing protein n=1 Tax=Macrostomum lignano TaxID=282301 RepID=A0A1I8JP18_9PLAT
MPINDDKKSCLPPQICREAEASLQPGQHLQRLRDSLLRRAARVPCHSSTAALQRRLREAASALPRAAAILVATDHAGAASPDCDVPAALSSAVRVPRRGAWLSRVEHVVRTAPGALYRPEEVDQNSDEKSDQNSDEKSDQNKPAKSEWLLEAQDRIRYAGLRVAANDILDAGPANSQLFVILVEKSCPNSSDLMAIVPSAGKILGVQLSTNMDAQAAADSLRNEDDWDGSRSSTFCGS